MKHNTYHHKSSLEPNTIISSPRKRFFYIFILIFFIFVCEASLASIVFQSHNFGYKAENVFILVYALQFFCTIPQGSVSDFYCRKKSLIVAFSAITIAQGLFLYAYHLTACCYLFFFSALLIYGFLGNVPSVARAGLIDTGLYGNFRLSMGLSTVAIALGWVSMAVLVLTFPSVVSSLVVGMCVLSILLALFIFQDLRDKDQHPVMSKNVGFSFKKLVKHELSYTKSVLGKSLFGSGLFGYFLAEIAFYLIFYHDKGNLAKEAVKYVIISFALGYCLGIIIQSFFTFAEKKIVLLGIAVSASAFFLLTIVQIIHQDYVVKIALSVLFAAGYGIFIPSVFSIISEKKSVHHQGKIYGLIDATDAGAMIIALSLLMFLKEYAIRVEYLYTSAFIFIILSVLAFKRIIQVARE